MAPSTHTIKGDNSSPTLTSLLTRAIARSPTAINERRQALLPRTSIDVESQTSSSGSTLLEERFDSDDDDNSDDRWNEKNCDSLLSSSHDQHDQQQQSKQRIDPRIISDAIIGLSDGLTVPFALTAGLSALGNTRMVIFAGLAELTAGAISMGLGGYLGAKSEEQSHIATLSETHSLTTTNPSQTASTISSLLSPYSLPCHIHNALTTHFTQSPHLATDFIMRMSHQSAPLSPADFAAADLSSSTSTSSTSTSLSSSSSHSAASSSSSRAFSCAATIALSYFLGGFIPLLPYFFFMHSSAGDAVHRALAWSIGVMVVSLFAFGYAKTCFVSGWTSRENVREGGKGGVQMVVVGGLAAGCAMGLVRLFDSLATA